MLIGRLIKLTCDYYGGMHVGLKCDILLKSVELLIKTVNLLAHTLALLKNHAASCQALLLVHYFHF